MTMSANSGAVTPFGMIECCCFASSDCNSAMTLSFTFFDFLILDTLDTLDTLDRLDGYKELMGEPDEKVSHPKMPAA